MNNGAFGENFPYSNFHDLNTDWIIKIAKDFLDQYTHIQEVITEGEESLQNLTTSGLEQLQTKADALEALLQQWYNTHSEDIANQLADALADLNNWYTQHQNYLDQTLLNNIAEFNSRAEAKATQTIATIPSDYTALSNHVLSLENADKLLYPTIPCQYIIPSNLVAGYYYWHQGTSTTANEHTYILPPVRVYAGCPYTLVNVYGYFCTLKYDDGTLVALSDSTLTVQKINFTPQNQNGYVYVTVYDTHLTDSMLVAGINDYSGYYFQGFMVNPNKTPTARMKMENEELATANSSNVTTWVTPSYEITGNQIVFTAPASGNTGFYVTPNLRYGIHKIIVDITVTNNTGGQITIHVWDKQTANFADHLCTIISTSTSRVIEIDLDDVHTRRPSLDLNNWVILFSNTGNSFSMTFNPIKILINEDVPKEYDGDTLGNIIKTLNEHDNYIECGQGRQFTRLRDAIAYGITKRGSTVVVYPGTYNLANEFATEITQATGMVGIELTNDIYVKFLPGSYVTALFPTSSQWISNQFQPFFAGNGNFTLDGLNISARNCRYCVHDELNGLDYAYHHVYKNCIMKFTVDAPSISGGTNHYMQCIGGGLGRHGYIEIDGGEYTTINNEYPNSQQPISFHNGVTNGCVGQIFIKDVYIADKGIIRLGCYGPTTEKTPVYVCGCSMYDTVYKMYEVPSAYQVDNFRVVEWNNTIRR